MTALKLDAICVDGGTQPRETISLEYVEEIAEAMLRGDKLPPAVVYYDGSTYWLADGFHRYEAHKKLHRKDIEAEIHQGTRRDAILYSCGANAEHGLRRSNADKHRVVQNLLLDRQPGCLAGHKCENGPPSERCWSLWGDSVIARHCRVDPKTVAKLRSTYPRISEDSVRVVERGGTVYTQDTSGIARAAQARSQAPRPITPPAPLRRTVDPSFSQESYPDDIPVREVEPPPFHPANGSHRPEHDIPDEVAEFVAAFSASKDLEYYLPLLRCFPQQMTVAELVQFVDKALARNPS